MKKIKVGILFGAIVGLIDIIPMILQSLTWDAIVSAFSLWIVSGFLITNTSLKMNSFLKGILISFLILIPSLILVISKDLFSIFPIFIMTTVLGATLGFLIDKFAK